MAGTSGCPASSPRVTAVGGSSVIWPAWAASSAAAGRSQVPDSDSPGSAWPSGAAVAVCPGGRAAAKNQVSKRRGEASGVIQRAHGVSRSARSTRPRRPSTSPSDVAPVSRACRSAASAALLSTRPAPTRPADEGPASSTPDSSNVSLTAAQTRARARSGGTSSRAPKSAGAGPAHPMPESASLATGASLAEKDHGRGVPRDGRRQSAVRDLTSPLDELARHHRARSRHPGLVHRCCLTGGSVADFGDQLDFHRRVKRQLGHADRAAGVLAVLAEHLDEQLARPVDHLRLAAEAGRAGHEAGHLDDPADALEAAGRGGGGGERVQRAGTGHPGRVLGADLVPHLAGGG